MIKLQSGERIGPYRVTEFLARGGFAYVYRAEDKDGMQSVLNEAGAKGNLKLIKVILQSATGSDRSKSAYLQANQQKLRAITRINFKFFDVNLLIKN